MSPAGGFVVAWTWPRRRQRSRRLRQALRRFGERGGERLRGQHVHHGLPGQRAGGPRRARQFRRHVDRRGIGGRRPGSTFAQRFSASGARRGAEFRVNTYTTDRAACAIGRLRFGGQLRRRLEQPARTAATTESSPSASAAWGRPRSPSTAAGNQVLEPGETVDVRPSWRNFNGAAQTFSATLTDITGPSGATYTITDPAGDYGTVADGATAPCTDCYAVSVSNPPTRPALHWDASAVESIVPDTQGQQKEWRLHVGASFTDVPTSERVLSLHRDAAAPRRHRRLRPDPVLPGQLDDARADGGVRAGGEGRSGDTSRPPARRRCSPTSPRPAPSAAGSRS